MMPFGPDPDTVYPNERIRSVCFIGGDGEPAREDT